MCPGPIGHAFSWEISESLPSNCWFGSTVFYGSKTITRRATLSPSDGDTAKTTACRLQLQHNVVMSIRQASQCTLLIPMTILDTDYKSHASSDPSNRTLTQYDSEAFIDPRNYRPFVSTWLQGGLDWVSAPF